MKFIGHKIYLRTYEDTDAEALYDLHMRNKEFFQKYSPIRNNDYYTLEAKREFVKNCEPQRINDEGYYFGIFLKDTDQLIGNISLSHIMRGPSQTCLLGYTLDKEHNGKGYMTDATSLVVEFAFNRLQLHRIEAGVMPHNIGSIRVLEKAGFHKEGIAQKNVKINGKWEDHQMMAIISDKD